MGISAQYYHGGLSPQERQKRQEAWLQNQTRVMVCTNAFGMGIDKPDVRLVLHLELPDSLEAYFQEAGRAGRDRQTAHAVTYVGPDDVHQLRVRHLQSFPSLKDIRHLYQTLANYFQLATGSGEGQTFGLDMGAFLRQYRLPALKTHQGLRILSKEGFVSLSDGYAQPSRLRILADNTTLYDYQLRYPKQDALIKMLTRSYGGLDVEYGAIDEATLAARLKTNERAVVAQLRELHQRELVDYQARRQASSITFEQARVESRHLRISPEHLQQRYQQLEKRIEAVIRYTEEDQTCRSLQLLQYFGEKDAPACGRCDVCRRRKQAAQGPAFAETRKVIYQTLQEEAPLQLEEALERWRPQRKAEQTLRWMVDEGEVQLQNGVLHLPERANPKTLRSRD
jgi:ATP-dependent DNA helicase RecQ